MNQFITGARVTVRDTSSAYNGLTGTVVGHHGVANLARFSRGGHISTAEFHSSQLRSAPANRISDRAFAAFVWAMRRLGLLRWP